MKTRAIASCVSTKSLAFFCTIIAVFVVVAGSGSRGMAATPVRFMTFNVRYANLGDGPNTWLLRKSLVIETIKAFDPDVLGLQESLLSQVNDLQSALPAYTLVGCGRDDGEKQGEFTAMLVRTDRFRVADEGRFWFSDTPEVAGSKGWGAGLPRLAVWAKLADRSSPTRDSTDREFVVYNTHFDHQSVESRDKAGALMARHLAEHHTGLPIVVMGDFNAPLISKALQQLIGGEVKLRDTFVAQPGEPVGTFNEFAGKMAGAKIDFVFATNHWHVKSATIDRTHRDGRYPSDHFPVTAVLAWPSER